MIKLMEKANVNQDSNESFELTRTSRTFYKPAYTLYNIIIKLKVITLLIIFVTFKLIKDLNEF